MTRPTIHRKGKGQFEFRRNLMTNKFLYIYWALLYVICAVLGCVNLPGWVGIVGSLVFFVPPAILLYRAVRAGERKTIRIIHIISLVWMLTAVLLLILNILSVYFSMTTGNILYYTMVLVTSPMVCGQYWLLSIFLWACLWIASLQQLKR
jgi:hypothetical protein